MPKVVKQGKKARVAIPTAIPDEGFEYTINQLSRDDLEERLKWSDEPAMERLLSEEILLAI